MTTDAMKTLAALAHGYAEARGRKTPETETLIETVEGLTHVEAGCRKAAERHGWRWVDDCSPVDGEGAGIVHGPTYDHCTGATDGTWENETVFTTWAACCFETGINPYSEGVW